MGQAGSRSREQREDLSQALRAGREGRPGVGGPKPGTAQRCRSAVLDMHAIVGDSATKGSRGHMMEGCGVRLRELTFSRTQ